MLTGARQPPWFMLPCHMLSTACCVSSTSVSDQLSWLDWALLPLQLLSCMMVPVQGGQHPAQLLSPGEGAEVAPALDRMYAAPGSTPSPLSSASDHLIRAHVPRT